jgi:hypothetical protein
MTTYFIDSSALVKRYVKETGSRWLINLVSPHTGNLIFISTITPVEVMSAVFKYKREKKISARTASSIRLLLERHTKREYNFWVLSETVLQRALDFLDSYSLRAYDAVQLASAVVMNRQIVGGGLPSVIFIASDQRLLGAAKYEGLSVDDPNNYP